MIKRHAGVDRLWAALALANSVLIGCGAPATPADERSWSKVRDNTEVEVDPVNPSRIELFYVCGNEFNIRNANPLSVLLHWKVQNSTEEGTVVATAAVPGKKSETHFVTKAVGTVYLYYGNTNIKRFANQHKPCDPQAPSPPPSPPTARYALSTSCPGGPTGRRG